MGSGHVSFGSFWFISLGEIKKNQYFEVTFWIPTWLACSLFLDLFFALCALSIYIHTFFLCGTILSIIFYAK